MLSPPTWEKILSHYPVKAAFVELRPKTCSLMLTLGGSRIELQGTGCCQENNCFSMDSTNTLGIKNNESKEISAI